jgi:hypothetical protein
MLGMPLVMVCVIWLFILAFKESVAWGICCLLFSWVAIPIFIILHWRKCIRPLSCLLITAALLVGGFVLMKFGAVPANDVAANTLINVQPPTSIGQD